MIKKGAMFGLDARVALAILGTLSVISGAALFSAVTESQSVAILASLREVGKAWQQYTLDTARDLKTDAVFSCSIDCAYEIEELIESTRGNWNGPYLKYAIHDATTLVSGEEYIMVVKASKDVAWGNTKLWRDGVCTAGRSCSAWAVLGGYRDDKLFRSIDDKVDNGDGSDAGSFRWVETILSLPLRYHAYLEITPVEGL